MEAAIEEPVALSELTRRTGVSQRQLERLCKRYLGATPAQYYVQLRLERARRMLRQTDMSVRGRDRLRLHLAVAFRQGLQTSLWFIATRRPQGELSLEDSIPIDLCLKRQAWLSIKF